MLRLRKDPITELLTILAFSVNIYLLTFDVSFTTAFPAFLLLGGIVLNRYLYNKIPDDPNIDEEEGQTIFYFTMFALAGIGVGSLFVSRTLYIFPATISGEVPVAMLGIVDLALLHALAMAVSEEYFFRGIFLQLFSVMGMGLSIAATTLIGVIYHLRVYGTSGQALLYVAIAWTVFGVVAYRTRRLSPLILAHLLNNAIATIGLSFLGVG